MSRLRSTDKLIYEAHSWMSSFPGLLRMSSVNKSAEEKAELAAYAVAIARLNTQLWEQWQRRQSLREGSEV